MKLVSVIMPVYNAIEYLNRSVRSIINQTYSNLEIILVDDNSKDKSKELCKEYAKKDSRIKVLDTVGNGVSATRNTGIAEAKGVYLCFLDSDDEYEEDFVEKMVQNIEETDVGLVVCGYKEIIDNNIKDISEDTVSKNIIDYLNAYTKQYGFEHLANYPWNKLYMTEIIQKNNVLFDEAISVSEDAVFNMEYIKYIDCVNVVSDTLVRHYVRENSLVSKRVDKEMKKYTILKIYNEYKNNYMLRNLLENNNGVLGQYLIYCFLRLCNIFDFNELKNVVKEMQNSEYRNIVMHADCINANYKIFKLIYILKLNWMLRVYSELKRR